MIRSISKLLCGLVLVLTIQSKSYSAIKGSMTPPKTIVIEAFDAITKVTLPRFVLDFTSCGHKVYYSNEEGRFRMKAPQGFVCYVQISQPGYSKVNLKVDYSEISTDEKTYAVYLSRSSNSHALRVRDKLRTNLYLEETEVTVVSLKDSTVQRSFSDREGVLSFLLAKDEHYKVTARREGYHLYRDTIFSRTDGSFSLESLFLSPIESSAKETRAPTWRGQPIDARRDGESDLSGLRHYSIQVGATSDPKADLSSYQASLSSFGQVYLTAKDNFYRIRVGRYYNRVDAEQDLAKIRQIAEFETAFLSYAIPGDTNDSVPHYETASSDTHAEEKISEVEKSIPIVRLASYLNPQFFKAELVEGLGELEMMKKDEWTVALLRGFSTVEEAQRACEQAKSVGFGSAHLVEIVNGTLQKLQGF